MAIKGGNSIPKPHNNDFALLRNWPSDILSITQHRPMLASIRRLSIALLPLDDRHLGFTAMPCIVEARREV